ncbi:MAG: lamin tail domain-containing protein [Candidatus Portnoybacteria bacterium]|nr:lamin tail domain-containing protein [Candidatus Portnoybacteria bacterium]
MFKNKFKIKIFFSVCLVFVFCLPSLASAGDVVINEIMVGQTGAAKNEFIELYNSTENNIDLTEYKLKKKTKSGAESNLVSSSKFIGIIPARGYFLIAHPDYKNTINADLAYSGSSYSIASDNTIILYNKEDTVVDKVGYGEEVVDFENQAAPNPENNQSIERQPVGYDSNNNSADFVIQSTPNPQNSGGQEEIGTVPEISMGAAPESGAAPISNKPPVANAGMDMTALVGQEILFDGSLSSDPDNDELSYFWNFGDGATDTEQLSKHTYLYPGQYIASLLVNDGEFSDLALVSINIYNQSVIISEFMPAPEEGDAENEWIELFNQSDQIANLTNWQLDDQEGGSSPFVFPANSFIAPNQFLVLIRPITKIALNNDNDQVRLIYPDGSLAAEVGYLAEKKEGFSIAFDGSEYFWTKTPTPGSPNIITSNNLNAKEENLSANNPDPIAQQAQNTPENIVAVNLNQSESFSALNAPAENVGSIENKKTVLSETVNPQNQTASLAQSAQPNQKSTLILIISIIISTALLASWGLIMLSKRKSLNNITHNEQK